MATEEGARGLPVYMTPDAELSRARYFLTGWTLARYASRFRADQRLGDDDEADGVDPPPAGPDVRVDQDGSTRCVAPTLASTSPPGRAHHPILRHRRTGARSPAAPVARVPLEPFDETLPPPPAPRPQALRDLAAADASPPPPWTPPPVTTSAGSPAEASSARSSARSTRACSPPSSSRWRRPRGVSVPPENLADAARRTNRPRRDGIRGGGAVHRPRGRASFARATTETRVTSRSRTPRSSISAASRTRRGASEKRATDRTAASSACARVYAGRGTRRARAPFTNTRGTSRGRR